MTGAPPPSRSGVFAALLAVALSGCGPSLQKASGLAPVYPPPEHGWPEVDGLRPTLRWAALPPGRTGDGAITEVRYDVRIWEAKQEHPGALVYERRDLAVAEHRPDEALKPDTRYYWSVRARFMLDGRLRLSPWTVAGAPRESGPIKVQNASYFRFETPSGESGQAKAQGTAGN